MDANVNYKRLKTREVSIGDLRMGSAHPIRIQTMTTPDTMDTEATVAQTIRCVEAGADLVRITAPSKKEAEHLAVIKKALADRGYHVPLVADIHFTPNAAEIAARLVEKVRINPGNYIDKKKFNIINYTDAQYREEIERIQKRFTPLVKICREYGTAMRIGTNHGSLSDRIMSRYGDTPMGMVESAMEFLRIARYEGFHNIVLSMKSSNPQVMVQAYRLLIEMMNNEFGECYPLHLGVTEAGDGEDGRIKSAVGIGTLLEDGIGDTVRVSLTEEPELELPVCRDLVTRYPPIAPQDDLLHGEALSNFLARFKKSYSRRITQELGNMGGKQPPVVIADLRPFQEITPDTFRQIGYAYNKITDKWAIYDLAADYVLSREVIPFSLPGSLKVITDAATWKTVVDRTKYFPLFTIETFRNEPERSTINFVEIDLAASEEVIREFLQQVEADQSIVLCIRCEGAHAVKRVRNLFRFLETNNLQHPALLLSKSPWKNPDQHLIHFATECGSLLLEGYGDGLSLQLPDESYQNIKLAFTGGQVLNGRHYKENGTIEAFLNATSFSILQATRTRISMTEYISCPSCGRTLFDLQETTAQIRAVTSHLKGVKIAIMGCIVNGPGEMADADFGYVGSGIGKVTLYRGKEVVKRALDSKIAVAELINLLKESGVWVPPPAVPEPAGS